MAVSTSQVCFCSRRSSSSREAYGARGSAATSFLARLRAARQRRCRRVMSSMFLCSWRWPRARPRRYVCR
eukprot:5945883-Pyramimonas_sp.AAC.1